MRIRSFKIATTSIVITVLFAIICFVYSCGPGSGSNSLPADARPDCIFSPADFAALFASNTVTLNGIVNPANGFNFGGVLDHNCRFYQWAEQMFLWVTSPAPPNYGGGGGRIFASPAFLDVTPPDASGNRTLVKHTAGAPIAMSIRDVQAGVHGLRVISSKNGQLWEVAPPVLSKNRRQLILDAKGDTVEIARATIKDKNILQLFDTAGMLIDRPRPVIALSLRKQSVVQPIAVNGSNIFLNPEGSVIEVEQGEADNAILETQNGSLVYYSIMVNDVYAYYLTGLKDGGIVQNPVNFPTAVGDLNQITTFARAHGASTFPDSVALAVELKASWVEASTLSDPQNYIQMDGIIPTYDKSNPANWQYTGTKTTTLALVGIHVVGSIANHPELIWATFEHNENTPNAAYSYFNTTGTQINVPQNTVGSWLFCANGSTGPFNQQHMSLNASNIQPVAGFSISPSNTIRWKAWGNASDQYPSQEDPLPGNVAYSNTRIISINNSVHGQLAAGDVRANYNFIGATWTFDGSPGNFGNGVGTNRLCNSTMETYQQGTNNLFATGATCFSCHSGFGTNSSHIFATTKPLF